MWVTRIFFWGVQAAGAKGWQPYHFHVPIVLKSGGLNLLEPSGPVQGHNWIPLPFACMYDSVPNHKHTFFAIRRARHLTKRRELTAEMFENSKGYKKITLFWKNGEFLELKLVERRITIRLLEHVWNVMAHAQKPDFVFQRNRRIHLNWREVSSVDYWQPRCAHQR